MKSYFQWMNFPRLVILISFLASSGLGWFVFDRSARLAEVKSNLQPSNVDAEITRMQDLGLELERYQEQVANLGTISQQDLPTYIRDTAASPEVKVGSLEVTPSKPKPYKDSKDIIYKFSPKVTTQSYSRNAIANFLYKLEFDNRRVKVTSFDIRPSSGGQRSRSKPGEIFQADLWTFEAEITYRTKSETN